MLFDQCRRQITNRLVDRHDLELGLSKKPANRRNLRLGSGALYQLHQRNDRERANLFRFDQTRRPAFAAEKPDEDVRIKYHASAISSTRARTLPGPQSLSSTSTCQMPDP